jgi:hypothetical protein
MAARSSTAWSAPESGLPTIMMYGFDRNPLSPRPESGIF